jgi:tetratricopeptide (TPR) repeat protein
MNTAVRLSLAALALAMLGACGDSGPAPLDKARSDFVAQDYAAARTELFSALEQEPGNREALVLLASTQIALGDADAAERAVSRLEHAGETGAGMKRLKAGIALLRGRASDAIMLIVNDFDTEAWRLRAEAYLALGKDKAAADAFAQGMKAGNDLPLAVAYARFALNAGDLGRVSDILHTMQRFAPSSYNTLVLAGDLASARGQTDLAVAAYRKTIAAYPDKVPPMLALANAYDEQGKVDEAMAVVERARKTGSDDPALEELRIQLLSEKGEWEAIRLALQGREGGLDPSSGSGLTYAEALLRLGQAEQARVLFNRALLLAPQNFYARRMLGEAQLATGDPRGAWATLKPLAAGTLARPEVLALAERAARASGDPQAGVLKARLDPARLKATMALADEGQAALSRQDWAGALTAYRELLRRGDDAEVLGYLATASARSGQAKAAIAYVDRALKLAPGDPERLHAAALVRLELGKDPKGARKLLEAAASADPDNAEITRDLGKAKAAAG